MAKNLPPPTAITKLKSEEVQLDEEYSFEDIGLNDQLVNALKKQGLFHPTPIQRVAIPLILQGKDVVARAKTGSGKTFAYLLPLLQKLFSDRDSGVLSSSRLGTSALVLVPTKELCVQVYKVAMLLIELSRVQLKIAMIDSGMSKSDIIQELSGPPDILISTPGCVHQNLTAGILQPKAFQESLSMLILDEADLLLSYGYEDDLQALTVHVPRRCQCLLLSATSSDGVEKLKKLILHNPYILTLPEVGGGEDEIIPSNVDQFWISCGAGDKFIYILALLRLELVQKKVLLFTNTIDMGYKLKLFLETFWFNKVAVLNAGLPYNSRHKIIEGFNAGLYDYLIATDDGKTNTMEQETGVKGGEVKKSKKQRKQKLDAEFGVVRGIDFKNVYTVVNFDMPPTAVGYIHRIGRTGRASNSGTSVSLVSPAEMEAFEELKSTLAEHRSKEGGFIAPFPFLTNNAVESLRYRAKDKERSITARDIREARAQDLRNEILNSETLKGHFEANPRDWDILNRDKLLSKKERSTHLRDVPEYLLDATTQEASKIVKLNGAAMRIGNPGQHPSRKRRLRKNKDPLKAISAKAPKQHNRKRKRTDVKEH